MSRASPRPNKRLGGDSRRRPSRRRWVSDQVKRAKAQALRAKLQRPRVLGYNQRRVLQRMGQVSQSQRVARRITTWY